MSEWPIFGCTPTNAAKGNLRAVIYHNKCKYTLKEEFPDRPDGYEEINRIYDGIVQWLNS